MTITEWHDIVLMLKYRGFASPYTPMPHRLVHSQLFIVRITKHCHLLRSKISSSSSSPSSKISCPLPSLTNPPTIAPRQASTAIPHQANPTIPIFNPRPYTHPANAGPNVLVPLLTL